MGNLRFSLALSTFIPLLLTLLSPLFFNPFSPSLNTPLFLYYLAVTSIFITRLGPLPLLLLQTLTTLRLSLFSPLFNPDYAVFSTPNTVLLLLLIILTAPLSLPPLLI